MVSLVGSGMSKMERFTRNPTVNIPHSLNLIRMTVHKISFQTLSPIINQTLTIIVKLPKRLRQELF